MGSYNEQYTALLDGLQNALRDALQDAPQRNAVPSSPAQLALPSEPPTTPFIPVVQPTEAELAAFLGPRSAELMLAFEREEGPMTRAERLDASRIMLDGGDAPTSPVPVVRNNDEPPPAPARFSPPPVVHLSHAHELGRFSSHMRRLYERGEFGFHSGLSKNVPSFPGQPLPVLPERAPEERPEPRPALDLGVCAVCQEDDAPKEVVFQGCAHVSTCVACSWELVKIHNHGALGVDAKCPVCRTVSMPMRLRVA